MIYRFVIERLRSGTKCGASEGKEQVRKGGLPPLVGKELCGLSWVPAGVNCPSLLVLFTQRFFFSLYLIRSIVILEAR